MDPVAEKTKLFCVVVFIFSLPFWGPTTMLPNKYMEIYSFLQTPGLSLA